MIRAKHLPDRPGVLSARASSAFVSACEFARARRKVLSGCRSSSTSWVSTDLQCVCADEHTAADPTTSATDFTRGLCVHASPIRAVCMKAVLDSTAEAVLKGGGAVCLKTVLDSSVSPHVVYMQEHAGRSPACSCM